MIRISIAGSERYLDDADSDWITQQIERRRKAGQMVCVSVAIANGELDMRLSTPECGSGGGGRAPTPREAGIFELWAQMGLNQPGWGPGNVVAFLRRLKNII
jgi:hypothetical protein